MAYGCYGYLDPGKDMLKVIHYIADARGFRKVVPNKPVEVYPGEKEVAKMMKDETGNLVPWHESYFPIGCGGTYEYPPLNFTISRDVSSNLLLVEIL